MDVDDTRQLFAKRVEQNGGYRTVAEKLGCTEAYVGLLISGKGGKRPSIDMARAIEDLLGIPMRSWTDDSAPQGAAS